MRLALACLALTLGQAAYAGAWLREDGAGFLATSVLLSETGDTDATLYAEYGLRPRLTIGLKIDTSMTAGQFEAGTAIAFAKRPIPAQSDATRLSYTFGVGTALGSQSDTLLRTGLSFGRGITLGDRAGWIAIDGLVDWSIEGGEDTVKLDSTFGVTLSEKTKAMVQLFIDYTDETTTTIAPSLIWQPRPQGQSYQIGVEAKDGDVSLRLGLWRDF